ncbi:nucleic acid binding OB-fold tRNA/helicase-type [Methanococcus aeolicus Nankai-3]|uniref:Nucleic acid binding OB-fold tRNA/helicase-type n=1 Tax=Methanococcus aeolicus (strain ATCC BAA-1280 / DSM 17508 / OCM 812 / Nankai-3) TaxID=419665 RepID=A6UUX5_META3|nr:nucleic acid-binding protein [Methanococcus aeolicus]ABR56297.1 nucleic acid binding OB-fold tRNA/helicase-type [Methanococcus aeolicus Nankai-3]
MGRRWTAYKIHPNEVLDNEFSEKALIVDGNKIYKVRLMGKVQNLKDNSNNIFFEIDGVSIRDFDKKSKDIKEEDFVDIIGRVGEYEGSRYVALEICKKITDNLPNSESCEVSGETLPNSENCEVSGETLPNSENCEVSGETINKWKELRALEIEKTRKYMEDEEESQYQPKQSSTAEEEVLEDLYESNDMKNEVMDIIKEQEGISYEKLLESVDIGEEELDKILEELIDDGEIYEPTPGIYKEL